MGAEVREDHMISDSQGNVQKQSVTRRQNLLSEDPSTLKFAIDNMTFIDNITKRMTGWTQVYNSETGTSDWEHTGRSTVNDFGKGWIGAELESITTKMVQLSNYMPGETDKKKKQEALQHGGALLKNMKKFGIESASDCVDINTILMRATDAAYGRALFDKGAKHFYGSLDEGVTITPRPDRKLFGIIPY